MYFLLFFSTFSILSAILINFSKNPIFGIMGLVSCFFNAACLLFCLGFDYLPLIFIVIYVGAIAVLLLVLHSKI